MSSMLNFPAKDMFKYKGLVNTLSIQSTKLDYNENIQFFKFIFTLYPFLFFHRSVSVFPKTELMRHCLYVQGS